MKRAIAVVFLFLYAYNFVGYLAVFTALQHRAKKTVKRTLMAHVPESQLVRFSFFTPQVEQRESPLQWIEENEFRYRGGLYDVARMFSSGDSTIILALRDDQEERLFADLDKHVSRHMGTSTEQARLDAFQEVFKDSYVARISGLDRLHIVGIVWSLLPNTYTPVTLENPSPPPRSAT